MREEERQRVIRTKLARMQNSARGAVATGFTALDTLTGGGLPRGRIVEIFGPSSSGKTTLALQIAAEAQAAKLGVAWIDADHAFDPAYAELLSVDLAALPLARPESAEEAMEMARQLAASGAIDLLVLDSAAALAPRMELDTPLGDSSPGLQNRVLASGLRKLSAVLGRTGVAALLLNQTRGGAGEHEASAAGPALKLHASVRILLDPSGRGGVRLRAVKNRVATPFSGGELRWGKGAGFAKGA